MKKKLKNHFPWNNSDYAVSPFLIKLNFTNFTSWKSQFLPLFNTQCLTGFVNEKKPARL